MTVDINPSPAPDAAPGRANATLARRQLLLRSAGKGAALFAATLPLKTLAGQNLLTFDGLHQCSISGMQSGVQSATPTGTALCGGHSPGWWGQASKTVAMTPRRAWPLLPNGWTCQTPCHIVFTQSRLTNGDVAGTRPTLFQVMEQQEPVSKFENTDEYHWICAWLNALSFSFNYPYTGQQVLAFYNQGIGSTTYQDALTFFKTYMEKS